MSTHQQSHMMKREQSHKMERQQRHMMEQEQSKELVLKLVGSRTNNFWDKEEQE